MININKMSNIKAVNLSQGHNFPLTISYSQCLKKHWPLESDKIDLWFFSFRENDIDLQILSDDEVARGNAFKFELHKKRFLHYRSMLRKILSFYTSLTAKAIKFGYNQFGKPYILNSAFPLEFNLSHSEGKGVIGITKFYPIGVDIEEVRQLEDMDEIVMQHFSNIELQAFKLSPEIKKCEHFYRLWTCKEAFIKALGNGFSYPLDQFSVEFLEEQCSKISEIKCLREKVGNWSLQSYFICIDSKHYMVSYAIKFQNMYTNQYVMI